MIELGSIKPKKKRGKWVKRVKKIKEKPLYSERKKYITAEEAVVLQGMEKGDSPIEVTKDLILESRESSEILSKDINAVAKKKANAILKSLQNKMMLDVASIAPKAIAKMVELMDATEPVYHMGMKIDDKQALTVQKDVAKTILSLVKPKEDKEDSGPSLAQIVINNN